MQVRMTVLDPQHTGLRMDVLVTAPAGTVFAQVSPGLMQQLGRRPGDGDPLFFADGREVPDDQPVGVVPLVSGAVLTVGQPGAEEGRGAGTVGAFLELDVVSGPDAGHIFRLRTGRHVIGRAGDGRLRVEDPDCSRAHAELHVSDTGVSLRDLGSTNGTWLDDVRIGPDLVPLTARSHVVVGSSTLALRVPDGLPAAVQHAGEGFVDVNRSPRIVTPPERVEIRIPAPPEEPRAVRVPLVAMVVPVLVAVPLALLWSPLALLFALTTPVMVLGNLVSDKLTGRAEHRRRQQEHETTVQQSQQRLVEALALETVHRRSAAPDPADLLRIATGPLQRVWERRPGDDDFLALRLGTRAQPSRAVVVQHGTDEPVHPDLPAVPVTVNLAEVGVLGAAGPRHRTTALVRSLLAQVATLHSPRETRVVLLSDAEAPPEPPRDTRRRGWQWESALWLPHLGGPGREVRRVSTSDYHAGASAEQAEQRVAELVALLEQRTPGRSSGATAQPADPAVVVLLDGAQRLRSIPGVPRLLTEGADAGIYTICLDADEARLPVECRATAVLGGEVSTTLRLRVSGRPTLDDVVADLTSARWFERVARALAPLRDATPDSGSGGVPDGVRLVDVLTEPGVPDVTTCEGVVQRWASCPRSTVAVVGVSASGPYSVDLRRDGPHVLVGGTTGAGKSELLQTLITSLALANRPDEMGFVLVDYKGGSAFAECARLPHTLGLVTDLDEHLTRRALDSLTAEITRRERLLARYGAKDVDEYITRRGPDDGARPRLARLVVVIDEFRVLAEELPAFLDGLVRIAAVGRSLGIHVVLATQRPGGVVTADIKANVNLRIALRVRDAADSVDVIETRDAAGIPEVLPGRAFARTGSSGVVEIQVARVGGTESSRAAVAVRPSTWQTAGERPGPSAGAPGESRAAGQNAPTDLALVVDAVAAATAELGINRLESPWLAPLAPVVPLEALPPVPAPPGQVLLPFGLLDLPDQQRQETAALDLSAGTCLGAAGAPRCGRTTLLRTLAVSAAVCADPHDVVVYALDGGGALSALAHLPGVAAVVPRVDTERATRLLRRLADEVGRRQAALAAGGFSDLAEQRASARAGEVDRVGPGMPYLLLLVDDWPALQQAHEGVDAGRGLDPLPQILRSGPGVGVVTVVTGDRSVLTGQLGAALPARLVLRMADPTDVVLAGASVRDVPASLPAGRGLLVGPDRPRVLHVACASSDPDGQAQIAAIGGIGRSLREERPGVAPPFLVPEMPERISLAEVRAPVRRPAGWLPLGVGGDDVAPVGFDVDRDGRALLVAGHPGSGRSTALVVLALGLARLRVPVAVVTVGPSPLARLAGGANGDVPGGDVPGGDVPGGDVPGGEVPGQPAALGAFGLQDGDRLLAAVDTSLQAGRPAAVLVDDSEQVDGSPLEPVLRTLVDRLPSSGEVVVLAGSTPQLLGRFQGVGAQVRKGASGVLLGPVGTLDGDLFGVRTPRRVERRPGRGLLVQRGRLLAVQVADPGSLRGPEWDEHAGGPVTEQDERISRTT